MPIVLIPLILSLYSLSKANLSEDYLWLKIITLIIVSFCILDIVCDYYKLKDKLRIGIKKLRNSYKKKEIKLR